MKRFLGAVTAILALLACTRRETIPTIPEGAIAYRFEPTLITYHFIDSSKAGSEQQHLELTWLPDRPYYGYNCLGFSPRTPQDTIGTFVFIYNGLNQGQLERRIGQLVDTTAAYFLYQGVGTHGSYATDSNNRLRLTWTDGTPARYFDPAANLHFSGDTLWSHVELSDKADSVHVLWNVAWTQGC